MSKIISRTREGARSFSRQSGTHELDQTSLPEAMINNSTKIGGATVEQLELGFYQPNVQSAINDVSHMFQAQVGEIRIFDDGAVSLNGISMVERLTFTGTATDIQVEVYGIPVAIERGANQDTVTTKALEVLQALRDKGIAIKTVQKTTGVNNKIDVEFLDVKPHKNYFYQAGGITIQGETNTMAVPGYGSWTKIAEQTIPGSAGGNVTMHYFKRIA